MLVDLVADFAQQVVDLVFGGTDGYLGVYEAGPADYLLYYLFGAPQLIRVALVYIV